MEKEAIAQLHFLGLDRVPFALFLHSPQFYDEPHEVLRVFFVNLTDRDQSPVAVAALDEQRRNRNLARNLIICLSLCIYASFLPK